jgi:hypothetical protein
MGGKRGKGSSQMCLSALGTGKRILVAAPHELLELRSAVFTDIFVNRHIDTPLRYVFQFIAGLGGESASHG